MRKHGTGFGIKIGDKFGRLEVVYGPIKAGRRTKFACRCECGGEKTAWSCNLVAGTTKSCGCLQRESAAKMLSQNRISETHSMSKHPLYHTWHNMIKRCSPGHDSGEWYYDRGIRVCDRWMDRKTGLPNFVKDMGPKPEPKHTLERIDNNGNYEPSNCRWATWEEQCKNKRPRLQYKEAKEILTESPHVAVEEVDKKQ